MRILKFVAAGLSIGSDFAVHYCQRCDVAVAMRPRGNVAECPSCGVGEPALRLPLFVVTGASGSGKTSVYPHLAAALRDSVVFDVDWLIDSFAQARQPAPVNWPAFRDAWLAVAHGVAQGGRHTVLLGPFMPDQLTSVPARRWVADIHFAALDCDDDVRRARLAARPRWRARAIDDHIAFAAHLRKTIPVVIPTHGSPVEVAERVAEWVRAHIAGPRAGLEMFAPGDQRQLRALPVLAPEDEAEELPPPAAPFLLGSQTRGLLCR
jgi:hypothetical protein